MCPDFGTPKNNKFSIWKKMVNVLFLGVPILNVVVLLFYVHGKHLRSCRDGQLT